MVCPPVYFTWGESGQRFSKTIFRYLRTAQCLIRLEDEQYDFENCFTVQTSSREIFSLRQGVFPELTMYERSSQDSQGSFMGIRFAKLSKARPLRNMFDAGFVFSHSDNSLYVTGGDEPTSGCKVQEVERYDLGENRWYVMPKLEIARKSHSCCAQGDYIYVCGGIGKQGYTILSSIERFNVKTRENWVVNNVPFEHSIQPTIAPLMTSVEQ